MYEVSQIESALLKIYNDILASMDAGKVTSLNLLNFSAGPNTTDYTTLLRRLDEWFGVTGKAVDWFKSYLTGRCQRIRLGHCLSSINQSINQTSIVPIFPV